jgi:pyruvate carboxylase subunit A
VDLRKVLVANRGEVALRVMRTCREMGVRTVAVYSEADAGGLPVAYADQALSIGPPPAPESYLNIEAILRAARASGADAVHPGYGFLAENPTFARRCEEEGLVFVGPSSRTLALVGDKSRARTAMAEAGLPISKGSPGALASEDEALQAAEGVGYPVILKAAGGGGGIGMVVVRSPPEMGRALRAARSSAQASFANPDVFLEKFHEKPRHIEFQVVAERQGHCLVFAERECSIQRRYQKLIEESPSPAVSLGSRDELAAKVAKAAATVGYTNAGTFEFLLADGRFHFNEVNARLQVEHPVTELIHGVDLVRLQLLVAGGDPLPMGQGDLHLDGWAMECRINAEDPSREFAPSPGTVGDFSPPLGPGVRVDTALARGAAVPPYYDPLVAKVVTHGNDRAMAIARMERALRELVVTGISTNISFHRTVLADEAFRRGDLSTNFIAERRIVETIVAEETSAEAQEMEEAAAIAAAAAASPTHILFRLTQGEFVPCRPLPWAEAGRRELMSRQVSRLHAVDGKAPG